MRPYSPAPYRLAVATSPTMRRQAPSRTLGQKFDEMMDWGPAAGDVLRLVAHSMAGYLGYYVWMTAPKKSFPRYFGLVLGVVQTFGALCDVISIGQRIAGTHPPEASPEVLKYPVS